MFAGHDTGSFAKDSDEIAPGFERFAADVERDPDRLAPVYSAAMLILRRPGR